MSKNVPIALACWDYDRTQPLADGRVRPDGLDLTYLSLPIEETFFRMIRHREFDAAEMSLSSYVVSMFNDDNFVAIPAFPSRAFRHNAIYVNTASGIEEPADLVGKIVGVPEYQLTANVWIRGILADRHGVPVDSVRYRTGGLHEPGRVEKAQLDLPPEIEVEPIPAHRTLADMLVTGEIDALCCPRIPRPFLAGAPEVARLFPEPRPVEERYLTDTGIFPIMHTVVLRRELYERRPWIAQSLFKAFQEAKRHTEERLSETAAALFMLPWLYDDLDRAQRVLGKEFWPYGLADNETTLRTFLRYAHEQGLAKRQLEPADLFAPETYEAYLI
ncbi:MAG: ABC transporter substrate-binding protein [Pseudonocardiaceae bacterium]|nr:ABC transporter substrate-binding protein [Pseudonocardiaceae bacterium]